jgi:hypothetical protein
MRLHTQVMQDAKQQLQKSKAAPKKVLAIWCTAA